MSKKGDGLLNSSEKEFNLYHSAATSGRIPQHRLPHHVLKFYPKDILQVIIGASIMAIPVGFTEEAWTLGETLPLLNVMALGIVSIVFISSFVFYNYYRYHIKAHFLEFMIRVFLTYFLALLVVSFLLTLIQVTPWNVDFLLSLKRVILVTFPASMSAAVADMVK